MGACVVKLPHAWVTRVIAYFFLFLSQFFLSVMKLTAFLRKILPLMMAVATVTVGTSNSYAGVMHTGVSPTTYTDFGQNTGRYTTNPNALLEYLRMRDGGIVINYTNGQPCYTIANEQGMISYASQTDNGAAAAVGYSYIATVEHNGEIDASFGQRYLGEGNNIRYSAIEYRSIHSFRNVPDTDYKVTRQSKIITDVSPSAVYTGDVSSLTGSLSYRAGAGTMYVRDAAGNQQYVMEAYEYIIGGINTIDSAWYNDNDTKQSYSVYWEVDYTDGGLYDGPLANSLGAGDSGSPVWVYNAATGQYEYLSASQSGNIATINFARGAGEYTQAVIDADTVAVHASSSTVYLNAVGTDAVSTVTDSDVTAHVWQGTVTDGSNTTAFNGVKSGVNTWANLAGLKDTSNWYNYGEDYLNAVWSSTTDTKPLTYADLFMTSNLRFSSSSASTSIVLTDTVDLGVGYAQFSGSGKSYYIISEEGENNLFNHAGYVVDAGVSVHLQLTNSADYMYEWRKVGAGDLYIDGTGNTNAFLNVGGSGKTYLAQNEGHAAYNVLANNGAVVVLSGGSSQIERDFTFGLGGGVLDMHGHSLTWNNGNAASADGFTIHALDELAVVANLKSGSTTTLTWTQGGQQTFLGSFADNGKDSALQFVYEGGAGARLDLHSIKTHLTATGSGMVVNSGTLALSGTNTVHGLGSESGTNLNRYHNALDWHYADAAADVTVNDGASFELGSHARLTGDVTVAAGGTFIMREGVQHAQEYIEGGSYLESTAAIADFYGLKGNVSLASGATMQVAYGAGVTANNIYSGSISGEGSVSVNLGSTASMFTLAGNNTFTGVKNLTQGVLVAATTAALGDTTANKWILGEQGTLVVLDGLTADNALSYVDASSTGTLALHENMAGVLDMSNHAGLFVGAVAGKVVEYGTAESTLGSVGGEWNLGGGGGELVVNALLNDASAALVLGNGQGLGGIVTLTNENNSIGSITFNEGVTLSFENAAALGGAKINLIYAAALLGAADTPEMLTLVSSSSSGSVLLDRAGSTNIDLSGHASLSLGSAGNTTYSGNITVAENAAYRFGGGSGTLTVTNALQKNGTNNLVVDGQTQSGGKLLLAAATDLTGAISVMGYDSAKTSSQQGDMTLSFTVDNALASASSLTVHDGGIVDLGTTTQTFTNVQVLAGGVITGAEGSSLVFRMSEDNSVLGSLQLDNAEKTGAGSLLLSSSGNTWELLTIKQGAVYTTVDNALSSTGITRVEDGGTLNLGATAAARTVSGNVLLADGGMLLAGSESQSIYFNGSLDVEFGATGTVEGGYWHLSVAQTNMSGGTLSFNSSQLHLAPTYAQHFGGAVDIAAGSTTFYSEGAAEDMLKHFNHIIIASGKALTLEDATWNTIWQLDKLSGEGSMTWNSDTNHNKTARLIISGDGEYSGTINYIRNYSDNPSRTHQSFLEINGQKAASGATLNMTGAHNSYASLALNAERVELGGINGNGYSHIMAGAAPADSASTSAPASSRNSTLVLTGSGNYTYSGSIGSAKNSATFGVSIQMSGSGIQNFNGADLYLNDVTALSGSLNISSSNLNVRGDIAVAQGAQLSLGDSFTVASGQSLQVLDSAADAPATFQSALTVASGGFISFEGAALSTGTAALNLAGGVTFSDNSAVFNFFNYGGLKEGASYVLASGDWSQLASSITATGLEYFDATFTGTSDSLTMTLSLKDGFLRWDGSDEKHEWGGSTFGKTYYPGAFIGDYYVSGKSVVFDDSAQCTDVVLTNSASPGKATFNASKDYHVSCSANYNYTQTIGELVQEGTGTTTLDAGVVVVTGDAIIKKGTLVVKDAATLRGAVYGDGTLALDLGANGTATPNLTGLNTLHIKSGIFGSTTATAAAAVNNIIIDNSGVYAQGAVDYAGNIVAQGGTIRVSGGALSGNLTLTSDSVLEVANGTSTEFNAFINQGEYVLTKTGNGTLSLGSQSGSVVLQDIRVQQGTLEYRDASFTAGKITVDAGAMLSLGYSGSLSANLIDLSGTLYLKNGNGSIVNAAIHTNDGAVINGSYFGGGSTITGRVYGEGELHLQSYQNKYTINSVIEDGSDALRIVVENGDPDGGEGVVLSAQNTYSGGTVVKSGVLHVANKQALGTGNVEIAGGTLTLAQDLTINSLSGSAGTLNLNGKTLTVGNGAVTFATRAADSTSTYSGALGSSGSITKVGSDTQVFDSADMHLENVSVQGGTLSLNDVASVSGDIYVASGATLETGGNAITLGEGQTLTAEAGSSVTLAGLTLNGGTLSLDLGAPTGSQEEAPTLSLAAAVAGSGGVITLVGDLSSLETAQLMLAKGDWSRFANGGLSLESLSLLGGGSTPLSYSLMANSEGLYLSLAAVSDADSNIWAGTADAHEWDADSFSVYGTGALAEKAIFNDSAAHKTVTLSGTVSTGAVEIVGGGYSFEGSGSIAAASVSAAGGGASTISNIALSGTADGTIRVDGSELTIVQLSPTNPSAPIALTNAAKLTIGDASHRYGAFSGKVTGDAGSQLHLYTTQVSGTYWQQDGTVQLLDGSTVHDVYIHGDLALNIIAGSQATIGDKFTNLQGANLHMDAGSQLVVRAEEGTGITPTTGNIVLGGDLSIVAYSPVTTATSITSNFTQEADATTSIIKKDTGSLTLSGNIDVDAIEVQAGTLQLTGSSINVSDVYVKGGALNMNHTGSVSFSNLSISGGTVNFNAASELTSATVTGGTVNFNAEASIDAITISGGNVKSTAATFGKQGGVITLAGGTFELNRNEADAEQILLSTLQVSNAAATAESPSTSVLKNAQGKDNMIRTLRAVEINDHNTLELQQSGWNTIWNINALTGEGNLTWSSTTTHYYSSRLVLSGDNDFRGNITLNRSVANLWGAGAYQAFIELASAGAAKNATLSLTGKQSDQIAVLAVNTDNAQIAGLSGNSHAYVYAGQSATNSAGSDGVPVSTAANTLTIAGAGDYTFAGTVGTSADAARLSLAMTGEGKQTFSGLAYVGNVSVSKGELVLSQANVDGSVTVSGGALNMMGSTYTLGSGDALSVLTGTEHAVQLGNLTLSGGEMVFDASLLNADTSALSVGTVSLGAGTSSQLITFNNIDNLESGRYILSGNWTAVDGLSFSTGTLAHGTANVVMQDGALYLDYTAAQYYTWTGAADGDWNYSSNNWDNTPDIAMDDSVRFIANRVAIFETDANVTVSEAVSADSLIVRNGATLNLTENAALTVYSIDVAEGSTLAFKSAKDSYTVDYITGSGTVELSLSANYENGLRLEGFAGEVYVESGRFDLYDATAVSIGAEDTAANQVAQLGSKLHLGAGVNMQIEGGKTVIVDADMQLDGSTEVHQNSSALLTVNGDVTGTGTWKRKGGGTLTFNGTVNLGGFEGSETNIFNGAVSLSGLSITGGTSTFSAGASMGSATISGGTVNFNGASEIESATVTGGTSTFSSGISISTATISGGTVNFNGAAEIDSATVSAGTVNFNAASELTSATVTGGTVNFNATAEIDAITITGGNVKSTAATFGKQGGVITLAGGTFELNMNAANAEQTLLSALVVSNATATAESPSTSVLKNVQGKNDMIRTLRSVEIAANNVLELQQPGGWNTVWNIESLTGEGELRWNYAQNHTETSRLVLTGDNDFSGQITFNRVVNSSTYWGFYLAYLELAHEGAAKNATIALNGTSGNGYAGLAISADNVQVQGINGSYAHIVSGAAPTQSSGDGSPHNSTESNTLTIAGADEYTYSGTIGTEGSGSNRLNLVMMGSGTQTFSGKSYVGNVSVSNGSLVLSQADVNGSVTVSGGALNMVGSTYTLGSGDVLSVLIGTENAVQLGGMTLSGGQMLFDASLLSANSAALSLGSAAVYTDGTTQTVTLDFSKLTGALANGTYKLASGDWSGANNDTLTYNGMGSASFNATTDGLYLVYTNDGVYTWVGGAADTNWRSANWDIVPDTVAGNNLSFADNKDVIFNTNATAVVTDAVTAGTVYILNGADVTFDMNGEGASLTAESLVVGNGKLTLSEHVSTTSISHIAVSEAGTLVIHQPQALGGSNSVLGKVSGEGTLVIDLASAGTVVYATGQGDAANLGNFTGTVDVTKGWLIVGNTNSSGGGAQSDFNAGKVIVRTDATLSTHFGVGKHDNNNHTIFASDIDLMSGATLLNIDGSTRYTGNIRFNVVDPAADNPTYDANGLVKIDQHWQKKLEFSGLLEGDGTVKLANTNNEENAIYLITGENNTFSGTFELIDDNGSGESDIIELRLGTETAAQFADIKLSATQAKSYLMLDSDTTINGLYGVVDGDNAVRAQGLARTLTVSVGDFGGSLQNGTDPLSLIKQGSGTLILRGANTYTGTTSITGGTLELAGAVSMAANGGEISVNSGATLLLNTTQTLTLNNVISGQGTIHKKGNQEVILTGDITTDVVKIADGSNQNANDGTLTLTGENVEIAKQLYVAHGSLNIGSGDGSSSFVVTKQLEVGDSNPADNSGATASITVREGSTLTVTGSNNGEEITGGYIGDQKHKNASFLLSEWGSVSTLTVEGSVLVQNAKVTMGDNKTIININGGTLAAQGITDVRSSKTGTGLELSLTNDGKLILGEDGLSTAQSAVKIELGEGTVGMSAASTTIAEDVTLNSTEGTTFDTTQYTYETNAEGVATDIVCGTEGGDLVLSGVVSSADGVDAAMKVVGAGTLHVAGEAAVSGDVTVDAGATLAVSSGSTAKATIRSADGAAAATISGGVTLSHGENSAAIAGRVMDVTEISNSLIELQQGVSLNLSHVHLAADSAVMGAGAAQATSGVMLMEGELTRNDVALESVSVAIALEQNATRGADAAVERVGSKVMMLDSSAFTYNNLTGSLTVEFSGELAAMLLQGGYDAVGLSFTGSEMAKNMTILGMYDGITGSTEGIFATDAGSSAVVYFSTDIIPEPATGTLSLLALAALAMRRRRR